MTELLSRLIAVVAEFGAALLAYLWARDRERGKALEKTLERQNAIREAGDNGPRDQSDAARRLRDGSF
ncbi:MAG: hypothetical protein WA943_03685 [Parvibaculum sp.]|uniref:hypothetical protein n=1 Tax=Parvibaculum sp. TaxID=2024848 RepID=UPI003C78E321